MQRTRLVALVLTVVMIVTMSPITALAKDYPSRPITLICPWGAGGGTDAVSRIVATLLKQELGVPVNVVNRTGGSGAVGHTAIATAKPDGYTLGMVTVEIAMMRWLGLTEISYKDLTPIAMVNSDPAGISVRADAPWKSYEELEKYVKGNIGKMQASGTGQGGIWHLAMAGWLKTLGLSPTDIKWIPSKGAAPALQDLMADGVALVTCSLPEAATLIEAGKVQPLALMGSERSGNYPDVPTLKEMGIDWACGSWRGIAAPKGTPQDIIDVLEPAMKKVVESPEFTEFMNNRGYGIYWLNSADFAKALEQADKDNGDVMKAAGLAK